METAKRTGRHTPRSIEEIPAFREHLKREGINFAEWERRQRVTAGPDATSEALALDWRKVNLNRKGK